MSDINNRCLEVFPNWLRTLGDDVQTVMTALETMSIGEDSRKALAGGINYLFKSLDLIPDGIDDIGYLDDAFILRLAAKSASDSADGELAEKLNVLSTDVDLFRELLDEPLFIRLEKYAADLTKGAARGRTVEDIVTDQAVLKELKAEVDSFVEEYTSPGFSKDEKNLIKLKSFLEAKLPR